MFTKEFTQKIIVLRAVGAERHFYAYIDVQVLTPDVTAANAVKDSHSNNMFTT